VQATDTIGTRGSREISYARARGTRKILILPLLLQYEAFNKEDLGRIDLPQYGMIEVFEAATNIMCPSIKAAIAQK